MDEIEKKETKVVASVHVRNRFWVALVLVIVGGGLLLQELKVPLPDWLFTWQILLIVIGVCMGFYS